MRKAKIEDYITLCEIATDLHHIHHVLRPDLYENITGVLSVEAYQEHVKEGRVFVFENKKEIIGYAEIEIKQRQGPLEVESTILFIHYFAIKQNYRKQEQGRKFFQQLEQYAKKKKCNKIELFAIPENETANKFYQKMGMQVQTVKYEKKI